MMTLAELLSAKGKFDFSYVFRLFQSKQSKFGDNVVMLFENVDMEIIVLI